jgi:hypothetical protein
MVIYPFESLDGEEWNERPSLLVELKLLQVLQLAIVPVKVLSLLRVPLIVLGRYCERAHRLLAN